MTKYCSEVRPRAKTVATDAKTKGETDVGDVPLYERMLNGTESAISLREAARMLSRDGRPAALATMYRFVETGKLEFARLPGGISTSRQAVGRMLTRMAEGRAVKGNPGTTERRTAAAAAKAHNSAVAELRRAGLPA